MAPLGALIEGTKLEEGCRAMFPVVACTVMPDPVPPAVTGSLIVTEGPVIVMLPLAVEVASTRCVALTASTRSPGPVRFDPMSV